MKLDNGALTTRAKTLGTLIRDARLASDLSLETCSQAISVSVERFEDYEKGEESPSMPELECLAYALKVPLEYFWETQSLSQNEDRKELQHVGQLIHVRQRMIGALLRQARVEADVSVDRLAEYMEVDPADIEAYELGEKAVPVPQLEVMSAVLSRSIREFHDEHGPVGQWQTKHQAIKDFDDLFQC